PGFSIPQELVDIIIDELFDDTAALLHCSFVCRSWTPTSQRHIFHSLTLGGSSNVIRFGKTGVHVRVCPDEKQYLQFNDFLEKNPHITTYIRVLDLRVQSYFKQLIFDSKDVAKALGLVLSKLTNLHIFRSNLGKWASFPPEFQTAISSVLLHQSITDVVLGISEFASASELALLLGRNPNLKHLSVSDSAIQDMSPVEVTGAYFEKEIYLEYLGVDTRIARLLANVTIPLPLEEVEILLAAWSTSRKDAISRADDLIWGPCRQIDEFLARNDQGMLRRVRLWFVALDMGYQIQKAGAQLRNAFPTLSAMRGVQLEIAIGPEKILF
ncbi:hypothetical protein C0991_012495, partial [Blastosporella zonata]